MAAANRRRNGPIARGWRNIRAKIKSMPWFGNAFVAVIYGWLKLVHKTNPLVAGSDSGETVFLENSPAIFAIWHGQHFLVPFLAPKNANAVALFSKSADAEINAKLVERMGFETVRGSGGRNPNQSLEKGGARALIALKRALDTGKSVVMIADISKSTPRQSGLGIIMLARISGRPIVGVAYASSRRHVIESSWDKTTVNLPFGRAAACATAPIFVPKDATDDEMDELRKTLDMRLNDSTNKAYKLADSLT